LNSRERPQGEEAGAGIQASILFASYQKKRYETYCNNYLLLRGNPVVSVAAGTTNCGAIPYIAIAADDYIIDAQIYRTAAP
jgi:hypothetical protein